jgi:lipoprotein NlpI
MQRIRLIARALFLFGLFSVSAQEKSFDKALVVANQRIEKEPKDANNWFQRGRLLAQAGEHEKAAADFSKGLELDPANASAYQARGAERFKLAELKEAIADFDKVVELHPDQGPYHWQRGIAYYYAGDFEKGQKQFESHQTVNPNDVENAVWHFLCVARAKNIDEARKQLIPISGDSRVPMKEIHGLFSGSGSEEMVLKAALKASSRGETDPLFYAHLYLGLYEEARGHAKESLDHIRKAVNDYGQSHYMGDVARVHLKLREKPKTN